MAEVKKSDFIYFQNEFLQELKQIDIKFTEKIAQLVATFQNTQLITDQKFEIYNDKISSLITKIETKEEYKKLKTELDKFKEYTNQEIIANSNKIYYLERDLSDACFNGFPAHFCGACVLAHLPQFGASLVHSRDRDLRSGIRNGAVPRPGARACRRH